ncbi:hypothetical protein B0I35DRAFT_118300 [Stachybotrys elegans]|uniref:Uncharacterized protein n=1 Tax=Stachybotrys elegans TaxID=80388 RepID=A0A8K0T469_9HYPO|nr:hypothetical protein B0I35DRAFT_118300 [Stachybotrys elegans]
MVRPRWVFRFRPGPFFFSFSIVYALEVTSLARRHRRRAVGRRTEGGRPVVMVRVVASLAAQVGWLVSLAFVPPIARGGGGRGSRIRRQRRDYGRSKGRWVSARCQVAT